MNGKIYKACVQSVMIYGSETWAMKVEYTQKLKRTEASMTLRICGVSLKHLSRKFGFECVPGGVKRLKRERWLSMGP